MLGQLPRYPHRGLAVIGGSSRGSKDAFRQCWGEAFRRLHIVYYADYPMQDDGSGQRRLSASTHLEPELARSHWVWSRCNSLRI